MIVTRSSGPTSFRMKAAAPALIASKRASSSSLTARTMIPVEGSSRLIRWVVSMPPGAGSERSIRMMSGDVSRARSTADRLSSASPSHRSDVEPTAVGADGQGTVVTVDRAGDRDGRGRAVLAYILQCFLQDAQDHRLLGGREAVGRRTEIGADRQACQRGHAADR